MGYTERTTTTAHKFGRGGGRYVYGIKPVSTTKNSMRNQPCPCGSRKKFKKCCWSKVY